MGRLAGKVVVVTGAARGQGAAEVALLAAEGASVIATDVLDDLGSAWSAGWPTARARKPATSTST